MYNYFNFVTLNCKIGYLNHRSIFAGCEAIVRVITNLGELTNRSVVMVIFRFYDSKKSIGFLQFFRYWKNCVRAAF